MWLKSRCSSQSYAVQAQPRPAIPVALRSSRHASTEPKSRWIRPSIGAGRIAARAAEVREVDLVVLDPADREAEVDLQRPQRRSRPGWRRRPVDRLELGEDLVPLGDVALIQPVVGLDRGARDAVELEQRRLQLTRLDSVRVGMRRHLRLDGTASSISLETGIERRRRNGVPTARPAVRARRARAAHRRADDGDPPRQASRRLRHEPERCPRGHRVDGPPDRRGAREPRDPPRRQAGRGAEQRRRPREPLAVLGVALARTAAASRPARSARPCSRRSAPSTC